MSPKEFLDSLCGDWVLTGEVHLASVVPLNQEAKARWVLGGNFVQMECRQTDEPAPGKPPYEALYLFGFDAKAGKLVFHLFDTFGVSWAYDPGIGELDGNKVRFTFPYESGPFYNTVNVHDEGVDMTLSYLKEGEEKLFATKRLRRK